MRYTIRKKNEFDDILGVKVNALEALALMRRSEHPQNRAEITANDAGYTLVLWRNNKLMGQVVLTATTHEEALNESVSVYAKMTGKFTVERHLDNERTK